MNDYRMLIGGALVDGAARLDVVNPATGAVFATVPRASAEQAREAVAVARRAQPGWAGLDRSERNRILLAFADALHGAADEIARVLVQEQGKPLEQAQFELSYGEVFIRHFASQELAPEILQDDAAMRVEVHHRPIGVVAAITPWNFPVLIACYKLAPATMLGNTMVMKPAPTTPITTLMLARLAADIFPPGVFNVIVDDNDLGEVLSGHPDVNKISFTGSTATGRKIMRNAASSLKRLTLELGGNDAGIVLPDADVSKVAKGVVGAAFANAGQVCIALKRLYVHDSIYEQMCAELAKLTDEIPVGDGLEQGSAMGPLHNKAQYDKALGYLEHARADGRIIAGGTLPDGPGYFMRPTIVRDIADGSPLVDEEQFSPILPVIRYTEVESVVASANRGEYGLGGSIWSANEEEAVALAHRIDSGTVWVNHHLHFAPHIPFGGAKQSGLGVEFGRDGMMEYTQRTVISVAR